MTFSADSSQLITDERVRFVSEPQSIEDAWISLMSIRAASGSAWTDAYLASFAMGADFRVAVLQASEGLATL
jgi:hypothetical protein